MDRFLKNSFCGTVLDLMIQKLFMTLWMASMFSMQMTVVCGVELFILQSTHLILKVTHIMLLMGTSCLMEVFYLTAKR